MVCECCAEKKPSYHCKCDRDYCEACIDVHNCVANRTLGWSLPVGGVDHAKNSLELIKRLREVGDERPVERDIAAFFSHALTPFYDCMWEGMQPMLGHVVYRLSDQLSDEMRDSIRLYPSEDGSIVDEKGTRWDSLNDFRREWESKGPIPERTPLLGEGTRLFER